MWKGQRRILVEEVDWTNQEVMPHRGHHRPVFDTDYVMKSEGVPGDDICVLDEAVRLGPGRQTFEALAAGNVSSGSIEFVGLVRGHPKLMRRERANLIGRIVRGDKRERRSAGANHVAAVRSK